MSDASPAGSTAASAGSLALAVLRARHDDTVSTNVAIQQLVADLDTTLTNVRRSLYVGTSGWARLRRLLVNDLCNNPRSVNI